jgi:hypothetical protein
MVDNGSTNDPDDRDYANESNDASSKIEGQPGSWKQMRQTKNTEDNEVAALSTYSFNAVYQTAAATLSDSIYKSKEIPIYRYLTLKTIKSKVVYCLTFSQELLLCPWGQRQRQDSTTDLKEP